MVPKMSGTLVLDLDADMLLKALRDRATVEVVSPLAIARMVVVKCNDQTWSISEEECYEKTWGK